MRPRPGGLGGTFAGSPLACAAGLAVLEVMREEQLLARAQEIGRFMSSRLKGLQVRFPCVGDVRALGAMVAIELVKNGRADAPDAELTRALVQAAGRHGLIILSCGHVRERDPLPRPAHDSRRAAEGRFPPVRAGARGGRRRGAQARPRLQAASAQPLRRLQARPALASVGVWKYSLSEASCSIRRFSSAMRPCAVLIGMQS